MNIEQVDVALKVSGSPQWVLNSCSRADTSARKQYGRVGAEIVTHLHIVCCSSLSNSIWPVHFHSLGNEQVWTRNHDFSKPSLRMRFICLKQQSCAIMNKQCGCCLISSHEEKLSDAELAYLSSHTVNYDECHSARLHVCLCI